MGLSVPVSAPLAAHAAPDSARTSALLAAVGRYFELMYDCDVSRFDDVFAPFTNLHGELEGRMVHWTADAYKDVLRKRQPPKSLGAARSDRILLIDFASPDMGDGQGSGEHGGQALRGLSHLALHRRRLACHFGYYVEDDGSTAA